MRPKFLRVVVFARLVAAPAHHAAAQTVTGSPYGTVTDTSGARLLGVTVALSI